MFETIVLDETDKEVDFDLLSGHSINVELFSSGRITPLFQLVFHKFVHTGERTAVCIRTRVVQRLWISLLPNNLCRNFRRTRNSPESFGKGLIESLILEPCLIGKVAMSTSRLLPGITFPQLSDGHTRWERQRINQEVWMSRRKGVRREGHILFRNKPRERSLLRMARCCLVSHLWSSDRLNGDPKACTSLDVLGQTNIGDNSLLVLGKVHGFVPQLVPRLIGNGDENVSVFNNLSNIDNSVFIEMVQPWPFFNFKTKTSPFPGFQKVERLLSLLQVLVPLADSVIDYLSPLVLSLATHPALETSVRWDILCVAFGA
ncbi:hypothetical protein [Brazilian marseillevirus]|uniref:hypothetical protein n=1 Tax=Brazilian marseillevirus TaxID=1813599 RepID=UPI000784154D|nr:hypothetical protein A3303_gp047 [Brazilian marseillevirus]AMQ10555.1 hypothetical protein [Brazilian marseillevirus]